MAVLELVKLVEFIVVELVVALAALVILLALVASVLILVVLCLALVVLTLLLANLVLALLLGVLGVALLRVLSLVFNRRGRSNGWGSVGYGSGIACRRCCFSRGYGRGFRFGFLFRFHEFGGGLLDIAIIFCFFRGATATLGLICLCGLILFGGHRNFVQSFIRITF